MTSYVEIAGEVDDDEALVERLRDLVEKHPGVGYAVYTDADGLTTDLTPSAREVPPSGDPGEDTTGGDTDE